MWGVGACCCPGRAAAGSLQTAQPLRAVCSQSHIPLPIPLPACLRPPLARAGAEHAGAQGRDPGQHQGAGVRLRLRLPLPQRPHPAARAADGAARGPLLCPGGEQGAPRVCHRKGEGALASSGVGGRAVLPGPRHPLRPLSLCPEHTCAPTSPAGPLYCLVLYCLAMYCPVLQTSRDIEELTRFLDESVEAGTEGLIVKTVAGEAEASAHPGSAYLPSRMRLLAGLLAEVPAALQGRASRAGVSASAFLAAPSHSPHLRHNPRPHSGQPVAPLPHCLLPSIRCLQTPTSPASAAATG